jgi:hypothetical protein
VKTLGILAVLLLLSACAPRAVRCDERLQPINPPAASGHAGTAPTRRNP